ncbi:YvrJ family protein [Sedimentibacter sp. MB31-C6]|nr:YvrJ family protein [Sedimentibacter sp. MB36-C1]WSI03731.1 YvrJ family protein [Sedimentibacter sp. MB36-C1]
MDEILTLIGNFGFPIVVAVYLLVRIEKKLSELTESIHELTTAIKSM